MTHGKMKAAIEAVADAMRDQSEAARARVHAAPKVLSDGICHIVHVADDAFPPCVGYILTDLGEKLPLFSHVTRALANRHVGRRVKLTIDVSLRGSRYVSDLMLLPHDLSAPIWPCVNCGGCALPDKSRGFYVCRACHYQMEAKP